MDTLTDMREGSRTRVVPLPGWVRLLPGGKRDWIHCGVGGSESFLLRCGEEEAGEGHITATGRFEAMALLIMSQQVLWASSATNSPSTHSHLECFLWVIPDSFDNLKRSIVLRVSPKSCESVHIELAGPVLRSRAEYLRCKVEAAPSSSGCTKKCVVGIGFPSIQSRWESLRFAGRERSCYETFMCRFLCVHKISAHLGK